MFRRLSEPLPLSEASLLLLRPAMNAPVLNVGFLPVGPARAAVVAFAEEYGGIGIALGIRSNDSGQLGVIRNQEAIDFDVPLADAIEPLLAEAERMGFLFDEDMLEAKPGAHGRSEAMVHWAVLMGGMDRLLPTGPAELEPRAERTRSEEAEPVGPLSPSLAVEESQYPELILDDVAPLELAGPGPAESAAPIADDTFEDDPPVKLPSTPVRDLSPDLAEDFDEDLEGTLEDVLDEALADGFDADFDAGLGDDAPDWSSSDPLLSELDLTEPTAPIAAARAVAAPPIAPPRAPSAPPAPIAAAPAAAPPPPAPMPVAAAPGVATQVVLSKFRNAGASPRRSEVGADRSAELARIPIVRVRREVEKKVPFLARLLSSF